MFASFGKTIVYLSVIIIIFTLLRVVSTVNILYVTVSFSIGLYNGDNPVYEWPNTQS